MAYPKMRTVFAIDSGKLHRLQETQTLTKETDPFHIIRDNYEKKLTFNIRSSALLITRPFTLTFVFPLLAFSMMMEPPTLRLGLITWHGLCPSCSSLYQIHCYNIIISKIFSQTMYVTRYHIIWNGLRLI